MGQSTKRLRWQRKLIFNVLMLIGTWLVIEAVSCVALLMCVGSPAQLAGQRTATANQEPFKPGGHFVAPAVIHPYFGAVQQPEKRDGETPDGKLRVTEFGFVDDDLPIHKRSPDRVIVGILGGSVARQFSANATETLARELSQSPVFAGKTFQFVRLASNGYKQPQQLMILNYLSALGAEFDILINLDGFNEAVLPEIDNIPYGVFSAYPRDWGKLVAGNANPEFIRMAGYVSYLRQRQRDEARWCQAFPWRYSPCALLAWGIRKNWSDQAINSHLELMTQFTQREQNYCGSGPPEHFNSPQEMFEHCINLWSRCSLLMHQLSAARGIRYYHFLQPNQYLEGAKPIGAAEAAVAIDKESRQGNSVRFCFPLMKVQGARLAEAGVDFTDLTGVFADHPEPIYMDSCCHVVEAGDVIMAKAIAASIIRSHVKGVATGN